MGETSLRRSDAKHYRDRAEELRIRAETFGPDNRKMLMKMAEYYERFADEVEVDRGQDASPI
jgi:hypothetical protein